MKRTYGWKPDLPDMRDFIHAPVMDLPAIPDTSDLRANPWIYPVPYDQGSLGSCTGNGVAYVDKYAEQASQAVRTCPVADRSRLFIYFYERYIEGTVGQDAGAAIRDGIKALNRYGAPSEAIWPYVIKKFKTAPTAAARKEAGLHKATTYGRVARSWDTICRTLVSFPMVFGFTVYDSFESDAVAQTGMVPMPAKGEGVLGGHCVVAIGYDRLKGLVLVRNSWGTGWGLSGHCWMPKEYLLDSNLSDDFWVVQVAA